jgi:hypothetical protein
LDINKLLLLYPTNKEIDVICIKNGTFNELHGLQFGKRYKASLINSAFLPVHWEVYDKHLGTVCALEYLMPIEQWREQQINKIIFKK